MKKIITILLVLTLSLLAFASCAGEENPDDTTVRIGGMTGPTSIGMVKMMHDAEGGALYDFEVKTAADQLTPMLLQGELDAAAIPANLASILYKNSNGKIRIAAVNTLSVLSILEKGETVQEIADLQGKTIYAPLTAKGSVPEYTLRHLLIENGVNPDEDVTFVWKTPEEITVALKTGEASTALLPQPAATAALTKVEGLRTALVLNDEWEKLETDALAITGVLVVRADFEKEHPEAYARMLRDYKASIDYVNTHIDEVAPYVESYVDIAAGIAKQAIPACNLTYMDGKEMKKAVSEFLSILYTQNPASVGGVLPDDSFYLGADK